MCYVSVMDAQIALRDHSEILAALGGRAAVAEAIAPDAPARVGMWKTRNNIPPAHWPAIARFAAAQGRPDITVDLLESLAGKGRETAEIDEAAA